MRPNNAKIAFLTPGNAILVSLYSTTEAKSLRFQSFTLIRYDAVFEKLHLCLRFRKPPFTKTFSPFVCKRKVQTQRNVSVFDRKRFNVNQA